jgi:predicted phosphodiesterase
MASLDLEARRAKCFAVLGAGWQPEQAMRLAIISDIHANLEALRATLQEISTHAVDRVVCLGDIVGYNANPAECIAVLREIDALQVAGNHDRVVSGQITTEGFNRTAVRAAAWTRRRLDAEALEYLSGLPLEVSIQDRLVAVHGALHPDTGRELVRLDNDERRWLTFGALVTHSSGARICAFGHTHELGIFELWKNEVKTLQGDEIVLREDAYYLINPGSVGQSRNSDPRATLLILDFSRQAVTAHRVEYDASIPFRKSWRAGLLPVSHYLPKPLRNLLKRGKKVVCRSHSRRNDTAPASRRARGQG